jgi:hypothetical protein
MGLDEKLTQDAEMRDMGSTYEMPLFLHGGRLSLEPRLPPPEPPVTEDTESGFLGGVGSFLEDVGEGILEAPGAVVRGASKGVTNIFTAADDLADWLNENVANLEVPIPLTGIPAVDEFLADPAAAIAGPPGVADELTDEPTSVTGSLIQGISQFLSGYQAKGLKAGAQALTSEIKSKAVRNIADPAIRGAGADPLVFDPHEARLSDLLREHLELNDPITAYLASSPEDTAAEGRLKNALEGLVIGVGADVFIRGLIWAVRVSKARINSGAKSIFSTAVQRYREGKSPIPVGMSIEDVGGQVRPSQVRMREAHAELKERVRAGEDFTDNPTVDPDEITEIQRELTLEAEQTVTRTAEHTELRGRTLEDLEDNLPPAVRTATPPTPGPKTAVSGRGFVEENLGQAGDGVNFGQSVIDRMWSKAVSETGPVAGDVLAELKASGRDMKPKGVDFWDAALRLSQRARFWYEISAESFRHLFPDFSDDEMSTFIDLVAATSPQANPHHNIRRAVGVMSQYLREVPIDVDITSPASITKALQEAKLEGLKIGSFSGTFQYHLGLDNMPPLSTNDRQVASSFSVTGDDIAGNDVIYEVLSRFYIKMRDELNRGIGGNSNPYETWQLQALGWVQERIAKGNLDNDDYLQALEGLKDDLARAGIELPDGKLTMEVLLDPRVEQVVSSTLERFRQSPITTMEVVTKQTEEGAKAAQLVVKAREVGDAVAVREYEVVVKRGLNALITRRSDLGGESVADIVVGAVIGRKPKLSRMEVGRGTFEGVLSQNARIPLPPEMTDIQRRAVLAIMGRGLKQDASPASLFRFAEEAGAVPEGLIRTYSIFVKDIKGVVSDDALQAIQKALPKGHDINIKKVANGHVVDINPKFEGDSIIGPTLDEAKKAAFASGVGVKNLKVNPRHYSSDYLETPSYNKAASDLRREILDDASGRLAKEFKGDKAEARRALKGGDLSRYPRGRQERIGKARDRYLRRIGDIPRADKAVRSIHTGFNKEVGSYNKRFGRRLLGEGGG